MLNVISLGAGVQSTTMALMAACGEITPMPDCAIFADTQWEPKAVYEHLHWLMSPNVLPFPVHVVTAGSLRENLLMNSTGQRIAAVPWHMKMPNGDDAMGRRQCTKEYKIEPITKTVRELIGLAKGQRGPRTVHVTQWIGISLDEIQRMKMSRHRYIEHRWPLVEMRMSRWDCLNWMRRHGFPEPAKSSCLGCPYHSDVEWRNIRDNSPDEWADTVEVDALIRNGTPKQRAPGKAVMRGLQFMHRSHKPLAEVDLRTHDEKGQPDLFNNDCEGMCGV